MSFFMLRVSPSVFSLLSVIMNEAEILSKACFASAKMVILSRTPLFC